MKGVCDIVIDCVRFIGNDRKGLVGVHILQEEVYREGTDYQTYNREQTSSWSKRNKGHDGDKEVHDQKCSSDMALKIFLTTIAIISVPPVEEPILNSIAEPHAGKNTPRSNSINGWSVNGCVIG